MFSKATDFYIPGVVPGGMSGDAVTTRYWDCCKPSCSWQGNIDKSIKRPVASCKIDGRTPANIEAQSGCAEKDGTAYMCSNQSPWAVNSTFAYGFAGASMKGGSDVSLCCGCFLSTSKANLPVNLW